ncbi:ras GEF [Microstroma glucosiphilum]|uniref:Ras GEF n=1 Tax=Pseudomicrostroma glucosiphilum TaxID=1684307 RepID=A0A316U9P1_9BASI|nr:ras GEF [Pseudomicrostroma glucosiphilum]PWN21123.1 ras GEF [Pseudomicrostroma glucosiphilum]
MQDSNENLSTDTGSSFAPPHGCHGAPFETTSWTAIQAVARKYNLSLRAHENVLRELIGVDHEQSQPGPGVNVLDSLDRSRWTITARLTAHGRAVYCLAKAEEFSEVKAKPAKRFPVIGSKASMSLLKNRGLSTGANATSSSPSTPSTQAAFNSAGALSQATSQRGPTTPSPRTDTATAQASLSTRLCNSSRTDCLRAGDVLGAILSQSQSSDQSRRLPRNPPSVRLDSFPILAPSLVRQGHPGVGACQSTRALEVSSNSSEVGKGVNAAHEKSPATSDISWDLERAGSSEGVPSPPVGAKPTQEYSDPITSVSASAPTITELIAVLTSAIDNRLMTNFFLTFRIFMTTRQLLDLLIERFAWAMNALSYDSAQRRVVLVRTYAIFKYWLLHFFELDYLCDRTLRERLTKWLNAVSTGASASGSTVEIHVIKNLKNVIRDLKAQYMQTGVNALLQDVQSRSASSGSRCNVVHGEHDTGASTAAAETLFSPRDAAVRADRTSNDISKYRYPADPCVDGAPLLRRSGFTSSGHSRTRDLARPAPLPILTYDPLTRAISSTVDVLARMRRTMGNASMKGYSTTDVLLQSGFRRSDLLFVRDGVKDLFSSFEESGKHGACRDQDCALEHLGVHDPISNLGFANSISSNIPNSALDLVSGRSDPYSEFGWCQQGLKAGLLPRAASDRSSRDESGFGHCTINQRARACSLDGAGADRFRLRATNKEFRYSSSDPSVCSVSQCGSQPRFSHSSCAERQSAVKIVHPVISSLTNAAHRAADPQLDTQKGRTPTALGACTSSSSFPEFLSQLSSGNLLNSSAASTERSNIVQIDDIDLSSDEDDVAVMKALRRLPGARDLRMANRRAHSGSTSTSSVTLSVQGETHTRIRSARSATFSLGASRGCSKGSCRDSDVSASAQVEMMDPDDALAGYELVKGFRVEDFASDEDDGPGDVEEALRRLEGFIDEGKRLARVQRVEALWANSQSRQAALGAKGSTAEAEVEQADTLGIGNCLLTGDQGPRHNTVSQLVAEAASGIAQSSSAEQSFLGLQPARMAACGRDRHSVKADTASQAPSLASGPVPRVLFEDAKEEDKTGDKVSPTGTPSLRSLPPVHRCFLLDYKSEAIAKHFTLIERELFCAIGWTELVSDRWRERNYPHEVVDWEIYYKAQCQARQNAEAAGELPPRIDVETVVARFNLTCNWVASQVVLTRRVEERVAVISKFIRVAFKCYQQCNFVTLVEICLGLQSPWVERLHKTWARIGSWEMRVFRDLKALASPRHDFHHLRAAMHGMIIDENLEELITSSGPPPALRGATFLGGREPQIAATTRCVPFFGLFVSDLAKWHRLPSFIRPTGPRESGHALPRAEGVECDLQATHQERADLVSPPSDVPSQWSLNMRKIEQLGSTVKTILAFQQKAAAYTFEAEATLYNKCLRLRCLAGSQMTQLSPSDE